MFFAVGLVCIFDDENHRAGVLCNARYVDAGGHWLPLAACEHCLNFLFFRWLRNGGPALATSLAAFFDTFALMIVFRKRHGTLGLREVMSLRARSLCWRRR